METELDPFIVKLVKAYLVPEGNLFPVPVGNVPLHSLDIPSFVNHSNHQTSVGAEQIKDANLDLGEVPDGLYQSFITRQRVGAGEELVCPNKQVSHDLVHAAPWTKDDESKESECMEELKKTQGYIRRSDKAGDCQGCVLVSRRGR